MFFRLVLSKLSLTNEGDLVVILETYAADESQLKNRGKITSHELLDATYQHNFLISASTDDNVPNIVPN